MTLCLNKEERSAVFVKFHILKETSSFDRVDMPEREKESERERE